VLTNGFSSGTSYTYNTLQQLTAINYATNIAGVMVQWTYTYAAGQNNGRITQFSDTGFAGTGEIVNYTYDSLNRLVAATTSNSTGPQWGESYAYDEFGNLQSKTPTQGTAPQVSTGVNSANNQVAPSDANGNWLGSNYPQYAWDVENRLVSNGSYDNYSNAVTYTYDPWGKRVLQYASSGGSRGVTTCQIYFYGINGKRLGTYSCGYSNGYQFVESTATINQYLGKKLIATGAETGPNVVAIDRLGSVRNVGPAWYFPIGYFPYGEERTSTPDGTDKFGTYFRDGYGQDYADQRYYTSNFGRFWSPDRGGTAKAGNPITWNKYGYASGDPVNRYDPAGRDDEDAGCAAFDSSICEALGDTDPMNTGVMPPPGDVSVPCADAYGLDYNPFPGVADCPMTPEQYDELVEGPPAPCDQQDAQDLYSYILGYFPSSPLADYETDLDIVDSSDAATIDFWFVAALAQLESGFGTTNNAISGTYNIFSGGRHCASVPRGKNGRTTTYCQTADPYPSYDAALQSLLTNLNSSAYSPYSYITQIYNLYEEGNATRTSPRIGALISIYDSMTGASGDANIRFARCQ
jgi:RHS repeat-associated protein